MSLIFTFLTFFATLTKFEQFVQYAILVLSALFLTTTFLDLQTFTSIFTKNLQAQDLFFDTLTLSYCMFNDFFYHFLKVSSYVKSEQISDYCLSLTQNSQSGKTVKFIEKKLILRFCQSSFRGQKVVGSSWRSLAMFGFLHWNQKCFEPSWWSWTLWYRSCLYWTILTIKFTYHI